MRLAAEDAIPPGASSKGYTHLSAPWVFLYLFTENAQVLPQVSNYDRCPRKTLRGFKKLLMEAVLSGDTAADKCCFHSGRKEQ